MRKLLSISEIFRLISIIFLLTRQNSWFFHHIYYSSFLFCCWLKCKFRNLQKSIIQRNIMELKLKALRYSFNLGVHADGPSYQTVIDLLAYRSPHDVARTSVIPYNIHGDFVCDHIVSISPFLFSMNKPSFSCPDENPNWEPFSSKITGFGKHVWKWRIVSISNSLAYCCLKSRKTKWI